MTKKEIEIQRALGLCVQSWRVTFLAKHASTRTLFSLQREDLLHVYVSDAYDEHHAYVLARRRVRNTLDAKRFNLKKAYHTHLIDDGRSEND